jgi:hypothetical protein
VQRTSLSVVPVAGKARGRQQRRDNMSKERFDISEQNRLGGEERLLNVDERLKVDYRAGSRKPLKGALGRRGR